MAFLLSFLIAGPAWLRGGTHAPWLHAWMYVAGAVLLAWTALTLRPRPQGAAPGIRRWTVFSDPAVWLGLLLLGLLFVQWWNAGRALYYDADARAWAYSLPRHASLPSAITSGEARQMLDWFVPAWVLLLVLRSPLLSSGAVRLVWRLLVYNAGVLALVGVLQFAAKATSMFGLFPMQTHFFATFGYPNHAGSYYLMTLSLGAALLGYELLREAPARRWGRIAALGAATFLALVACHLCLSRGAILLSWALCAAFVLHALRYFWPRLRPVQRVHAVATACAAMTLAVLLIGGVARDAIRREFQPENDQKSLLERETDFRGFQIRTAARIWLDHPWFGVGGWGYRHLLAFYLPPEEWRRITPGKANVHNDPMQFLTEFGVLGAGAMLGVALLLAAAALRRGAAWPPLVLFPLLGAGAVALQSLIDLPFRSPAVLYLWLASLAGAARALPLAKGASPSLRNDPEHASHWRRPALRPSGAGWGRRGGTPSPLQRSSKLAARSLRAISEMPPLARNLLNASCMRK